MHLVVVGGSDAGVSAALRARELRPDVSLSVVVADAFPNFSICGLPFYLSGEVPDWRSLAHRTRAELERAGLQLLLEHTATAISPATRRVLVRTPDGADNALPYDRLVVATGTTPVRPPISGLDLPGVYLLHTMADSFRLDEHLTRGQPRSAIVVGSGYIGLEMADALTRRGLHVTLMGRAPAVLPTVDRVFGELLVAELRRCGVEVVSGVAVDRISPSEGGLLVSGHGGVERRADLVLVGAGVRPNVALAAAAGAATGDAGALHVDRFMATHVPDLYAAGDCVETWHRLLERPVYLPLGTTAHKQGRVAGENAVGGGRLFAGSVGTQVVKVFDLAVARTGLRDGEARAAGCDPRSPARWRPGITPRITPARPPCVCGSPEIARVAGCWAPRCSGPGRPRWPSGSTSSPRPSPAGCASTSCPTWTSATRRRWAHPGTRCSRRLKPGSRRSGELRERARLGGTTTRGRRAR